MKKFLNSIICISIVMCFCQPVIAGEFKVYSSTGYKQLTRLRGPSHISINGEAVMLLVDFSGSMGRWIAEAKETLQFILPRIPYRSAVALRVFGERATEGGKEAACVSSRLVTNFEKENQEDVSEGLSGAKLGGMTPLVYGLQQVIESDFRGVSVYNSNRTRNKKKIILVTDGFETCGGDPCAYIKEVMRKRNDIKIDVIQLGNSDRLACLAEATGGEFKKVDGSKQKFEAAFETSFNVPKGTVSDARTYNEKIIKPKRIKKCSNNQPITTSRQQFSTRRPPIASNREPLASNYKFVNYEEN